VDDPEIDRRSERMHTTKRLWSEPELIILARGRREESVLAACKMLKQAAGVNSIDVGCEANQVAGCPAECQNSEAAS
jgi:hypothetical protein